MILDEDFATLCISLGKSYFLSGDFEVAEFYTDMGNEILRRLKNGEATK